MVRRPRRFRRPDPVPQVADFSLRRFLAGVHDRLQQGAAQYGNESFERNRFTNVGEVLAEQLDTAGWLFVLWVQARNHVRRIQLTKAVLARFQKQFLTAVGTWIELGIKLFEDKEDPLTTTGAILDELTKLAAGAFFTWRTLQQRLDHVVNKLAQITVNSGARQEHIGKRGGISD
jgi:hypothetical protein